MGWLKATEIYSLTILEVRSPKSRCQQGALEALGENHSVTRPVSVISRLPRLWQHHPKLCSVVTRSPPLLSLSSLLHLLRTLTIELKAHLGNPSF